LGLGVVSGVSWARAADLVNTIEIFGTVTYFGHFVVDLTGTAGNSAYPKAGVKVGSGGTCLARSADKVESLLADAFLVDKIHVGSAGT